MVCAALSGRQGRNGAQRDVGSSGKRRDARCRPEGAALRVAPRRPPASRVRARGAHDAGLKWLAWRDPLENTSFNRGRNRSWRCGKAGGKRTARLTGWSRPRGRRERGRGPWRPAGVSAAAPAGGRRRDDKITFQEASSIHHPAFGLEGRRRGRCCDGAWRFPHRLGAGHRGHRDPHAGLCGVAHKAAGRDGRGGTRLPAPADGGRFQHAGPTCRHPAALLRHGRAGLSAVQRDLADRELPGHRHHEARLLGSGHRALQERGQDLGPTPGTDRGSTRPRFSTPPDPIPAISPSRRPSG